MAVVTKFQVEKIVHEVVSGHPVARVILKPQADGVLDPNDPKSGINMLPLDFLAVGSTFDAGQVYSVTFERLQ